MKQEQLAVIYGDNPREMTRKILMQAAPFKGLDKNTLFGIKPNLVKSRPSESGATTSPGIISGIIEYLQENGFTNIIVLESSWLGDSTDRAFKVCGYEAISQKYNVGLIDLKKDLTKKIRCSRDLTIKVCRQALSLDYMINVPVLKAHCQTRLTCALKNLKGCIPDSEKRRFHSLGLHRPIAYLNKILKNSFVIVDGIMGDLTHEEGGNPVEMGRIIAGFDPVLVDSYAAGLLGFSVKDIPYIEMAAELGTGRLYTENTEIIETDKNKKPRVNIHAGDKSRYLANRVEEREACSPCYGNLIHALQRLKDSGRLESVKEKVHIGQGFKGFKDTDICGIGNCASGLGRNIPGCPPHTRDIIRFLEDNWIDS